MRARIWKRWKQKHLSSKMMVTEAANFRRVEAGAQANNFDMMEAEVEAEVEASKKEFQHFRISEQNP